MRITALLFAFVLTGCTGDRLRASTKCDEYRRLCQIRLQHAIKSRQQWKWVATTGALAHDGVVGQRAPLARATPQAALGHGQAKRRPHEVALAIVGLTLRRMPGLACGWVLPNSLDPIGRGIQGTFDHAWRLR
jgi:hypothetical protein